MENNYKIRLQLHCQKKFVSHIIRKIRGEYLLLSTTEFTYIVSIDNKLRYVHVNTDIY